MGFIINCMLPGYILFRLNVENHHQIKRIMNLIGNNIVLIYNNMELLPSKTVGFYKMTPGCSIVAVNSNKKEQRAFWKNIDQQAKTLRKANGLYALSCEKEYIRLRDIRLSKLELKSKKFARRLCYSSKNTQNHLHENISENSPTYYEEPKDYCSNPLPIFWRQNPQVIQYENTESSLQKDLESNNVIGQEVNTI